MKRTPAKESPRNVQVFIVSSGGTISDWRVSSASIAEPLSGTFFGQPTLKVHHAVVTTKEQDQHALFLQALNRRLAGYSVVDEQQEPTDAQQEIAGKQSTGGY